MAGVRQDLDTWMVGVEKQINTTQRGLNVAGNNDVTPGAWASDIDTISTADKNIIPAGGLDGVGSGAPIRTRWLRTVRGASTVGNVVANANNLRLEIGYLFRDQSNWDFSSGVMVEVRTTYMHGGSYTKTMIYGGYNRPWKIVPLEVAGDQALVPFFSGADTPLPAPYYERPISIDVPSWAQATVQVSTDIPMFEPRPFLKNSTKKILLTGRQTDLTASGVTMKPVGMPWTKASENGGFYVGWSDFNSASGQYHQPAWSRLGNRVRLRGLLLNSGAGGTNLFNTPLGLRPEKQEVFAVQSANGPLRVDVTTDGLIYLTTSGAAPSWISLNGIEFDVDPTAA